MIDYRQLEAFATVVIAGSFDRAAARLHITQSAVSQRVKQLEECVGQILVVRTTPPHPTEAGQKFLAHYQKVQLLENELFPAASSSSAATEKPVSIRVGINNDSLATWFFDAVEPIVKERNIILDILVDDQEETQKLLQRGEVACSISTCQQTIQGCRMLPLGSMSYGLYCTPLFAKEWFPNGLRHGDLTNIPTIRFNRKDFLNDLCMRKVFSHDPGFSPPTYYIPSSEKFVDWLLRGLCYGPAPVAQCSELVADGKLVDLLLNMHVEVPLFCHYWNLRTGLLDTFAKNLQLRASNLLL
jgi:LysR family transcriptional regulator (chromosome initiation inhibitor)